MIHLLTGDFILKYTNFDYSILFSQVEILLFY